MEGRFFLEEESKVNRMWRRQDISSSSLTKEEGTNCSDKAVECACSACLFCVSCPLCIAWCCIKLPCKIGWKAAKNWNCCGSQKKVYASYSSFSDIEFESIQSKIGASSLSSSASSSNLTSSSSYASSSKRMHRQVLGTGKQKI